MDAEMDAETDVEMDDEMGVDSERRKGVALVRGVGAGGESGGGGAHARAGDRSRAICFVGRVARETPQSELSLLRKVRSRPDALPPRFASRRTRGGRPRGHAPGGTRTGASSVDGVVGA